MDVFGIDSTTAVELFCRLTYQTRNFTRIQGNNLIARCHMAKLKKELPLVTWAASEVRSTFALQCCKRRCEKTTSHRAIL